MIYTCKPSKISIYINTGRKTIAQVKSLLGCDVIINGGLFDGNFKPVCHLKADGTVYAKDQYTYWGYGWNDNDIKMISDYSTYKNYICCVAMVRNGQAEKMIYNADMGGARQRTAIGLFADGRMWIYCDKTGKTPEQLQRIALDAGLESAIMLDGGGSTQGIFPGGTVYSSRIVHNFICIWVDDGTDKEDKPDEKGGTALDIKQPNYKWAYAATKRSVTTHLILHHVGMSGSFTPEQIHSAHLQNGWMGIAYNYYIRRDGTIYRGRDEDWAGGHTAGYNTVSIGICFEGNFETEKMSAAQLKSGQEIVEDIVKRYPSIKIAGHRDLNATACPGMNFPIADIISPPKQPEVNKVYRVQVGAFTVKANADRLKLELESKGYKPFVTEV